MIFQRKLNFQEDFLTKQIIKIQEHIEEENYKEIEEIIDYIIISKEYHDQLDEEKRTFFENVLYWCLISQNKYLEAYEKVGYFKILKENVSLLFINFIKFRLLVY